MIQASFNSSCIAPQYETGTKFFHRAVPELHVHGTENHKISVQPCGVFHIFSKAYRQELVVNDKKEYSLCSTKFLGRRHRHPDRRIPSL